MSGELLVKRQLVFGTDHDNAAAKRNDQAQQEQGRASWRVALAWSRVVQMLKQDPQMRQSLFARISAPIGNKMFECAYTLNATATDLAGNSATATATCLAPH